MALGVRHSSEPTRRELEVVTLIAHGQSNRQIAEALTITERTAEGHTHNIRKKLGFSTRSQIAVWAVEQGLHRTSSNDSPHRMLC